METNSGGTAFTWRQTHDRCLRLSALHALAVNQNDVVSALAPNTPVLYEMHFTVPMAGVSSTQSTPTMMPSGSLPS